MPTITWSFENDDKPSLKKDSQVITPRGMEKIAVSEFGLPASNPTKNSQALLPLGHYSVGCAGRNMKHYQPQPIDNPNRVNAVLHIFGAN